MANISTTAADIDLDYTPVDAPEVNVATPTEADVTSEATDISLLTGQPFFGVLAGLENNASSVRTAVDDAAGDPTAAAIEQSLAAQVPVEEAAQVVVDTQEKQAVTFGGAHAKRMESYLTVGDPRYNQFTTNYVRNHSVMEEVVQGALQGVSEDTGWVGHVGDFLDYHFPRYVVFGLVEALMRKDETEGQKFYEVMTNATPEEAQAYAQEMMDKGKSEGFFTSENYQAVRRRADQFADLGHSGWHTADQVLAVVDAIPLVGLASKGIGVTLKGGKSVLKASTAARGLTKAATIGGVKTADDLAENAVKSGLKDVNPQVQDDLLAGPQSFKKDNFNTGPTQAKVDAKVAENKIIADAKHRYNVNATVRIADDTALDAIVATKVAKFKREAFSNVATYNTVDLTGLDNAALSIKLGKVKDASPYKKLASAERAADNAVKQGYAAKAVPVNVLDEAEGFYVEVLETIDAKQAVGALDLAETTDNVVTKLLGSTNVTTSSFLNTLANRAEASRGSLRDLIDPDLKTMSDLPFESKEAMNKIMGRLRDGDDAARRDYYSDLEFENLWKQLHAKKTKPSEKDIEAYHNMIDANDAAYKLKASELMKSKSAQGYKSFQVGDEMVVGRLAKSTPDAEDIVVLGRSGQTAAFKDLAEDARVFEVADELEGGVKYFTEPKKARMLQPEDVLGYNSGGPRINPDANYFVTLGTGRGRAIMTAFSEADAKLASSQLGKIFKAMKSGDKSVIDEVIQANNSWNPSIEDTDDMIDFMNSRHLNTDELVAYKARDSVVQSDNEFYNGLSFGDAAAVQQHRYDDVLMEFGGKDARQLSAVTAVYDQLENVAQAVSFRAYNDIAKTSWLKKAGVDVPEGADINTLFKETEVPDRSKVGRQLRTERDVIERREGVKDKVAQTMEDFGQQTREWVFEKSGLKIKSGSPTDLLLQTGFRSAFGFLNVSQFFLQASHAATITAISPKAGARAIQDALSMRMVMNTADTAAKKEGYSRLAAKHPFMSAKDFEEAEIYLRTDGRANITNDSILSGTGAGWGVNSWEGKAWGGREAAKALTTTGKYLKKADEVGLTFFNKGEQVARNQGRMTAIYEYKMKNPKGSIISKEAREWITQREQKLTFNMTTASRGAWQSGIMKVPTQWLSYSMRTAENVLIGRGFTVAERARMTAMLTAMGGTAGFGLTEAGYTIADWLGVDEDSPALAGIQYGVVDGLLSYGLTGLSGETVRTAFGSRLAPATAFIDVADKLTSGSFAEVAFGPSGNIVGGMLQAAGALAGNMDSAAAQRHLMEVLRTPSGLNNAAKAWQIWDMGQTTTKSGRVNPFEYNGVEGVMAALGVNNFKETDWYDTQEDIYKKKDAFFGEVDSLRKDFVYATQVVMGEDPSKAFEILNEIAAKIDTLPYPPSYKLRARQAIFAQQGDDVMRAVVDAIQLDMGLQSKTILNTTK